MFKSASDFGVLLYDGLTVHNAILRAICNASLFLQITKRPPSLMATAALRGSRWRVQHLGSGVPARDLVEFVEETRPEIVRLSVTVWGEGGAEVCCTVARRLGARVVAGGRGGRRLAAARRGKAGPPGGPLGGGRRRHGPAEGPAGGGGLLGTPRR